jgi:hypothetical protein
LGQQRLGRICHEKQNSQERRKRPTRNSHQEPSELDLKRDQTISDGGATIRVSTAIRLSTAQLCLLKSEIGRTSSFCRLQTVNNNRVIIAKDSVLCRIPVANALG